MKIKHLRIQVWILITVVILLAHSGSAQGAVNGIFLYNLSNFTGVVSCSWPRVFIDQERTEIYVTYQNLVKIFNEDGMEVYSFGDELDLGSLVDLTLDKEGDIIILSYKYDEKTNKTSYEITKCNYRGEPKSKIQVKNLPSKYSEFVPNRIIYWGRNFYFVSLQTMIVIIVDPDGNFKEDYDILPLLELEEKAKQDAQMEALSIDKDGNFLFTIPPLFRAYKITPDRKVSYFGSPGSIPGKFNIVAGITSDDKGNIFVVDKLKSSVMIYDKNFKFLNQFSSRGWKSNFLLAPEDIEIDNHDRVYITQAGKKGVSVFRITY